MIEINNPRDFFELQSAIPFIPFTQSKGWHDYQNLRNEKIRYFVNNTSDVKIALWGKEKKIPLLGKIIFIIEGEALISNLDEKQITSFYSELKKLNYSSILINSNNEYTLDYEIGIRRAGMVRPLGGFSCPLTLIITPQNLPKHNRNWKRNVKSAIDSGLVFSEIIKTEKKDIENFILLFNEMAELKNLSYKLLFEPLKQLINDSQMRLFFVKDKNETPIAARIVHVNGKFASDVYAANSIAARNNGASYFLMQNIFDVLKNDGIEEFDFGRIPPSDHATDNVYVFKKASGGNPRQYNGEWVYYKNKLTEISYTLYQLFKLKRQRY